MNFVLWLELRNIDKSHNFVVHYVVTLVYTWNIIVTRSYIDRAYCTIIHWTYLHTFANQPGPKVYRFYTDTYKDLLDNQRLYEIYFKMYFKGCGKKGLEKHGDLNLMRQEYFLSFIITTKD